MPGITDIVIGVRDLRPWETLLGDIFGYVTVAEGPDSGPLGRGSSRAVTWASPGVDTGRVRLVEVPGAEPGRRRHVQDLGIFDFDIYTRDIDACYDLTTVRGFEWTARPEAWQVEQPPVTLKQGVLLAPDGVAVALVESKARQGIHAWEKDPDRPYAEVTSSVAVVAAMEPAIAFWREGFGLPAGLDLEVRHPFIDRMLQLAEGSSFRMVVAGGAGSTARVELISFPEGPGPDRTAEQQPGSTGITGWAFRVDDLDAAIERALAAGARTESPAAPIDDAVHGPARVAALRTPDNVLVELWQPGT